MRSVSSAGTRSSSGFTKLRGAADTTLISKRLFPVCFAENQQNQRGDERTLQIKITKVCTEYYNLFWNLRNLGDPGLEERLRPRGEQRSEFLFGLMKFLTWDDFEDFEEISCIESSCFQFSSCAWFELVKIGFTGIFW